MAMQDDIKQYINEVKNHFDTNLNNKYVKNIILKLDLPLDIRHNMNIIFDLKTLYFDSKGSIEDIYLSINAIAYFIREVKVKVIPNIYSYTGTSFFSAMGAANPNDNILFQMAVKNYQMNIKILAKLVYNLLKMVLEYDKTNFNKDPAYIHFKKLDEILNFLQEVINEKSK